ncbi:MAG TPA: hypothetical protein VMJ52_14785 [Xanthobacteraceae bacterium]|nr:hypothetical protein [Xanthobacteraceae bacterium]
MHASRHDELALALLVAVAVAAGRTHEDWQFASAELQFNMQFVVVDV